MPRWVWARVARVASGSRSPARRVSRTSVCTAAAVAAVCGVAWSPVAGQVSGSLEVGASIIEYDGFLVSGAAVISPLFRFDGPTLSLGAQGNWTRFESGNQVVQGTAAAAWLLTLRDRWGLELSGSTGASRYADQPATGHVLTRARVHALFDYRSGAWIAGTTGGSVGDSTQVPIEVAAGAWTVRNRLSLVGTVGGSWLGESRHIDVRAAARWTTPRWELEARAGIRPWIRSRGRVGEALTGAWTEISFLVALGERTSLTLSGGSYPSDPVRRVLGAKYVTAGFRVIAFGSERSPTALLTRELRTARDLVTELDSNSPRIEIEPAAVEFEYALRVHAAVAASVEIMGDFTDWHAVPLEHVEEGIWEVVLPLTIGVHRLNVRLDGGAWVVPAGARREQGDFGNPVGVVVVR